MKFVMSKLALTELIAHIQTVVAQKASIPILANLLIEARLKEREIVITGTDLTVGVCCRAEAKVIEEGATTLPAKRFIQLIREITAPHIEFRSNENDITEITAGSSNFTLNGINRSEYPNLPSLEGATKASILGGDLNDALYRTAFAVSKEDNRYVLTGIHLQIENGQATFSGTDGKRLARSKHPIKVDADFSTSLIIPLKAVEEMIKLPQSEEEVNIHFLNDKIAIETAEVTIISKLLSGDYPDVSRIIPESSNVNITLHRDELISLLKQVSLFTFNNTPVRFTFSQGNLLLTANNAELGNGKVSMPVNYEGEILNIAFNPNFFLDILKHSKDETVTIALTDSYNPGVITDSSKATCVLMPMRL